MKINPRHIFVPLLFACLVAMLSGCSTLKHSVKNKKKGKAKTEKIDKHRRHEIEKNLHGDVKLIIDEALEWMGTPYEFGRQDKGVATDCSGFVMRVFEKAGYKLPRNSAKQAEFCSPVKKGGVKAGDLVFFITNGGTKINHVGLMIDDDQFIHASTKGVVISSMSSNYYSTHFQLYGRVPGLK